MTAWTELSPGASHSWECLRPNTNNGDREAMMSIKKQYLKDKCKVTFKLDKRIVGQATKASIAAEFNEWKIDKTPMKPLKNGDFSVTVTLAKGREYQYRYVVDGQHWITDDAADKYVQSGVANDQNAVVVV